VLHSSVDFRRVPVAVACDPVARRSEKRWDDVMEASDRYIRKSGRSTWRAWHIARVDAVRSGPVSSRFTVGSKQDNPGAAASVRAVRGGFPQPRCATCAERSSCHAKGTIKDDYPSCHRPLLGTSLARVADLLAWWSRFHVCGGDARLGDVQQALLTRLGSDRMRFSEVFEPSCSLDRTGWHFWRFSYAFPGFRDDPAADTRDLLAMCRPFGEELSRQVRTLLSPMLEPAVFLPLVGLAYDAPAAWRIKLYLQFRDDADDEPLRIVSRLTGHQHLGRLFRGGGLHLVGIDLGTQGIVGAKLYFRHPCIPLREVSRMAGPVELIDYLATVGHDQLRNLLVIHRMRRRDDPDLATAAEIDFALQDNDLCWEDLAVSPTLRRACAGENALAALESAFALGVRRISVPVGRTDKLNVYYVPTELDH
jgi:hypothetical protein